MMIKLACVVIRINCAKRILYVTMISVQTDGTQSDRGPRRLKVKVEDAQTAASANTRHLTRPLWELKEPVDNVCGSMSAQRTVSRGDSCWGIFQGDGRAERARLTGCETAV